MLIESGKVPADTSASCCCVRCSLGVGDPCPAPFHRPVFGAVWPRGKPWACICLCLGPPGLGSWSVVPDPEGSHVFPGSLQVLSRAGWLAWGAGSLVMNHVVLPALAVGTGS